MGTITYNSDTPANIGYIFRATNGGTIYSANLASLTAFDYFTDTAQVNDCIYFGSSDNFSFSNLYLNIGTPMIADCTLVWEYYSWNGIWRTMHDLDDGSNNFTTAGVVTVDFPLQSNGFYASVNGITTCYIRCRVASLNSISEGGANITTRVKKNNGYVSVVGFTDASPCNWTQVYNWIITNAPKIGAYKWGNSAFKFDNCNIRLSSRLTSVNEMVFFGNGCYSQYYDFAYLSSGQKSGANGWVSPSYYFFSTNGPSNITTFSDNSKIYGGVMSTSQFNNIVDGLSSKIGGYTGPTRGEHIGVYYPRSGYFTSGTVDRCSFEGSIITASNPAIYPTNLQISNSPGSIWSIYGNELSASNITYSMPSSSIIFAASQYYPVDPNYNIDIINPNPALPLQTGTTKIIFRSMGSNSNPTNVLYYDASAGTYTDYTTQATNNTLDDVPLSGDVGDIYYFKFGTSLSASTYQAAMNFVITDQFNDYEYTWEHSSSVTGNWKELPAGYFFDNTNNLTKSGNIYFATGNTWNNGVSVNGIAGSWMRLKITKKGSATPKFTRVYYKTTLGIWLTSINEKYTSQFTIQDENGNPMQGANVTLTDASGTVLQFTTDVNGKTISTDLTVNVTKFDKNAPESDYNYSTVAKNPFKIKVKKSGYETYNESLNIASKIDKVVTLKTSIANMLNTNGDLYIKLNPSNDGVFRDVIIDGEIIL